MIRVFEVVLPLDHTPEDVVAAVAKRLGIGVHEVTRAEVFREGWDARRRGQVSAVLGVDVETPAEDEVLQRLATDSKVRRRPDKALRRC